MRETRQPPSRHDYPRNLKELKANKRRLGPCGPFRECHVGFRCTDQALHFFAVPRSAGQYVSEM